MESAKLTVYLYLMGSILFAVLYFALGKQTLDINFNDTYFVIYRPSVLLLQAVLMIVFALINLVFFKALKPLGFSLGIAHLMLTLLGSLLFLLSDQSNPGIIINRPFLLRPTNLFLFSAASFIIGQIILIINMIVTLLRQ